MATLIATSLACLAMGGIIIKASNWKKNYRVAKTARFPVFYSPVHITDLWWLMLYTLIIPFLKLLPRAWKTPWLQMAQVWNIWKAGHRPFEEVGSDTFILATASGNMLWTCDPSVANQLFTQHGKSQIPVEYVKFFDLWGPTIGSIEGDEWRAHRKVITAGFNPTTNTAVWNETIHQTQTLVGRWIEEGSIVPDVKHWTLRLALHVLSSALFNKSLEWKEYTHDAEPPAPGHCISYEKALITVVARLGTIFMTPRLLLRHLPSKFFQEAYIAYTEWTKYMQELREGAVARIEEVAVKKNKSILESIVVAGSPGPTRPDTRPLPNESVLGNIFFTLFAGHETTGNTMAFVLMLLAIYPECQERVQEELDRQLGGRQREEWTLEQDYQPLQAGYVGAVLKEVLRLHHVVQFVMRRTLAATTVNDSKGETHLIPENTLCMINFSAAFKNPAKYTERKISPERRTELHDSPAIHFDPSRWLEGEDQVESKDNNVPVHWPFGQGPRSCVGRLFAQIEMVATVATVFKDHSLELVVDKKTTEACNGDSKLAWEKTRDGALRMMIDDIKSNISIYLSKDLPIRIVKHSG